VVKCFGVPVGLVSSSCPINQIARNELKYLADDRFAGKVISLVHVVEVVVTPNYMKMRSVAKRFGLFIFIGHY
jgi:hypothetical protein